MTLIARLPTHESVALFRKAAKQRFDEAARAAMAGDRLLAVYLYGYCVEMLLKAAFFRLQGRGPNDPVNVNDARRLAKDWGLRAPTSFHDLPWWVEMLVESRKSVGTPFTPEYGSEFAAHVNTVYTNWRESLRYRVNRPYRRELNGVRESASWLLGQYRFLYHS